MADCQMPPADNSQSRFLRSQIIFAVAPLLMVAVVVIAVMMWSKARLFIKANCRRRTLPAQPSKRRMTVDLIPTLLTSWDYIVLCLVIIFYAMHPFLTRRSLLMFRCTTLDSYARNGDELQLESRYVVDQDHELRCDGESWIFAKIFLGGPMLAMYGLGVPLLLLQQLHKNARKVKHLSLRTRVVFGFLFLGFEKKYYYWEIVTMSRKAILAGIAVFMSGRSQLISAGLVLTLSLVAQMAATPYQNSQMDTVESISLAVQTMTLLMGQYFFEGVLVHPTNKFIATAVVLTLNIGCLIWMAWIAYTAIKKERARGAEHVSAYSRRDIHFLAHEAVMIKKLPSHGHPQHASHRALLVGPENAGLGTTLEKQVAMGIGASTMGGDIVSPLSANATRDALRLSPEPRSRDNSILSPLSAGAVSARLDHVPELMEAELMQAEPVATPAHRSTVGDASSQRVMFTDSDREPAMHLNPDPRRVSTLSLPHSACDEKPPFVLCAVQR